MNIFLNKFFCLFFLFLSIQVKAESDQWKDSEKTYYDLIEEGFEVKAYDVSKIETADNYIFMLFVTVLQKNRLVYECHEYQTLDRNLLTLDIDFICRELSQPYKKGLGT